MIRLRQIRNHTTVVRGNYSPCDEGWVHIDFVSGVKTVYLTSVWEAVPVAYRDCSIRIEDTATTRYLIVDEGRIAFAKDVLISWLGDGTVKFQREVKS